MTTFKNSKFITRDYETTNVVFCQATAAPAQYWIETSEPIPATMHKLWIQGGVHYYGYL